MKLLRPLFAAAFLLCSCVSLPIKPPPKLADMGGPAVPLTVHFLGSPYSKEELYICSSIVGKTFDCLEYTVFQKQLQTTP